MKTLVIGASTNPNRYSYLAIERLVNHHIPTVAYGLKPGNVSGIEIDTELLAYPDIHTVTLYVNPERQAAFYPYILSLNPQRVIFNPGTENPAFMEILSQHKIAYEVACTLTLLATGQF